MRHATLTTVTDRIDHRLHPLPDHDRLHFHHRLHLRLRTKKEASGARRTCVRGLDASAGRLQRRPDESDTTENEAAIHIDDRCTSGTLSSMRPAASMKPVFLLTVIACARLA